MEIDKSRKTREKFRRYRNKYPIFQEDALDQAQLAIACIIQAMNGIVDPDEIIKACGDAKSPNAVSRALRSRLKPLR